MLPKFRSFVRPIIRSFVHSFIVPIHRSSFVHRHYSSFIVRSYDYSPSLFTFTIYRYYSPFLFVTVTIQRYYSSLLVFIITIHRHYSSSLLFIIITIRRWYLWLLFHRYCSLLLFIDHPITPNFDYSSIMLSSPPKTSQTHIPVIRTPMTVIFLPVGNFSSGHPSQVSPSWARLTLRFLRTSRPNSYSNNYGF
jgi:hypothetical protein